MVKFQHGSTESGFQFLWFEQGYVPLETLVGCHVVFEAVSGDVKEDVSISYFSMTLGANWSKECLFYKMTKVVVIFVLILVLVVKKVIALFDCFSMFKVFM